MWETKNKLMSMIGPVQCVYVCVAEATMRFVKYF